MRSEIWMGSSAEADRFFSYLVNSVAEPLHHYARQSSWPDPFLTESNVPHILFYNFMHNSKPVSEILASLKKKSLKAEVFLKKKNWFPITVYHTGWKFLHENIISHCSSNSLKQFILNVHNFCLFTLSHNTHLTILKIQKQSTDPILSSQETSCHRKAWVPRIEHQAVEKIKIMCTCTHLGMDRNVWRDFRRSIPQERYNEAVHCSLSRLDY